MRQCRGQLRERLAGRVAGGDRGVQGLGQGFMFSGQLLDAPGKGSQCGQDRGVDRVSGRPLPGKGISTVR
ncbi:hypothetical protein GCM10017744_031720 [Streptomyces antimycoticus]